MTRTPWERIFGPIPKTDGTRVWMNPDDFWAAHVAYRMLDLGEAERDLRVLGFRREDLASALGVTRKTIGHWFTQTRTPSLAHAIRLGRALLAASRKQFAMREDDS